MEEGFEVGGAGGEGFPDEVAGGGVLFELVGEDAGEGLDGDDAEGVEVAGDAGVAGELFGGGVAVGADGDRLLGFVVGEEAGGVELFDGSEVDEDEGSVGAADDVVGFDVAVDDLAIVDEGEGGEEVVEDFDDLGFGATFIDGEFLVEGVAFDEFFDEVEVGAVFEVGEELGDAIVATEDFEDFGFGLEETTSDVEELAVAGVGAEAFDDADGVAGALEVVGDVGDAEASGGEDFLDAVAVGEEAVYLDGGVFEVGGVGEVGLLGEGHA